MQIALTKKLSEAMGIKPAASSENTDPLYVWTANWINTFDGHKEDMVIMVNSATRFAVTIYGVKRNQFKNVAEKMATAIRNTLISLHINRRIIDEYFRRAGDIQFTANHDRKAASQVTRMGREAAYIVGRTINESDSEIKYEDTLGRLVSDIPIHYSLNHADYFYPREKMVELLSFLLSDPVYQYHAFELRITLDLQIYTVVRRLIVPADIEFSDLHHVLQSVFGWKNRHLYDFTIFDDKPTARLVASEEDMEYDETAILMSERKLSEFMPKSKFIVYTYDMGDNWRHKIELARDIGEYNEESPYLLGASGRTPPEDVGGIDGYIDFREIMLNPAHPQYEETKEWAGYWFPELSDWESCPRAIRR